MPALPLREPCVLRLPLAPRISAQGSRKAVQREEESERDRGQRLTLVHVGVPRTGIKQAPGDNLPHPAAPWYGVPPGPQGARAHQGRGRALLLL